MSYDEQEDGSESKMVEESKGEAKEEDTVDTPRNRMYRIRDKFHETPGKIAVDTPFGPTTISKGFLAYEDPAETRMGPQAMASYKADNYGTHKKLGPAYKEWSEEISDDETEEGVKQQRAQLIVRSLETNEAPDLRALTPRQQVAIAQLISVGQISDPLRTDVSSHATERDFMEQIKARGRGEVGFREIFGDTAESTFLPARTGGAAQQRQMMRELREQALFRQDDCLLNVICQAEHGRIVSWEELVAIRAQVGSVEGMLEASNRTIAIISNILGVHRSITIHYPASESRSSETFGDDDDSIEISQTEANRFVHARP